IPARCDLSLRELFHDAERTYARADDLDLALLLRVTVTLAMRTMKRRREVNGRVFHFEFERLPAITHRQPTLVSLPCRRKSLASQHLRCFLFHLCKNSGELSPLLRAMRKHHCATLILDHIRDKHADRRQRTGRSRHDHSRYSQRARKVNGMQTSRAAKRQQRKLSRIVPALDGDVSQRALHVCVRD